MISGLHSFDSLLRFGFFFFFSIAGAFKETNAERLTGKWHEMAAESFIDVLMVGPEGAIFSMYTQGFPITEICTPPDYFSAEIKFP